MRVMVKIIGTILKALNDLWKSMTHVCRVNVFENDN